MLLVLTILSQALYVTNAQYASASITVSPTQIDLGESTIFNYNCQSVLIFPTTSSHGSSFNYAPFAYAQITVYVSQNKVDQSNQLSSPQGSGKYTPAEAGQHTLHLDCRYYFSTNYGQLAMECNYGCSAETQLRVNNPIPPLTISLRVNPSYGDAPLTPTMTYDAEGGVAPYAVTIDFGDGSTPYAANGVAAGYVYVPSHTYTGLGYFTVRATATDQQGSQASDSQSIQTTAHITATINCPSSVYTGDQVSFSARVTASDQSNPQISYQWSAVPGAGSSSPREGIFDNPNSPTPKWTAPFVNAPMDYTIFLSASASGYGSYTATCKLTVSPQPNYGPIVTGGTIVTIGTGCGYAVYKKRKKKDDSCFTISCPDPLYTIVKHKGWGKFPDVVSTEGPGRSGRGGQMIPWGGDSFVFNIFVDWPTGGEVTFRVSGGEDLVNLGFVSNRMTVKGHGRNSLRGWRPSGEPEALYPLTVTAFGKTKSGTPCRSELLLRVHFCDDEQCSDGPFFSWPPYVDGNVDVTHSDGTTEKMTGSTPFQPGDNVKTFNESFMNQTFEDYAAKAGKMGGEVVDAGPVGSGVGVGPNSEVGWLDPKWLDPAAKLAVPWLGLPEAEQLKEIARQGIKELEQVGKTLKIAGGKMLLNWQESGSNASVILPNDPGEAGRWIASVSGTRLLVEATRDGSAAAITVVEDYGKDSVVELWRTDNPRNKIKVHGGEQLLIKAGNVAQPVKVTVDQRIGVDPFGVLRKWWSLPPATSESLNSLTFLTPKLDTIGNPCPKCNRLIPPNTKFCTNCGTKLIRCPQCGRMSPADSEFCVYDGNRIKKAETKQKTQHDDVSKPNVPCPNCGKSISKDLKFCIYCGKKVGEAKPSPNPSQVICRNCGKQVPSTLKFCTYCGHQVRNQDVS